jgi:hypothetical protein
MIDVCGHTEYVSDVLYALDPNRYVEVALELGNDVAQQDDANEGEV